ncbi:MAG: DHA2 family efflux MFS transporter permease subunit [Rhodospirillaceae bacterium]|nr:EmrB/QacA family drug resistance transporter [Rhodospirillaceae bacterium]MDC0997773.1 DHA2 family efflux MFS transporter permease subunit [Alphaproteobacteria bacterium]MBT4354134.1 DHA2 family efflux MFS transporter permease subunit [Rhodospirillaceae bacterium]MBT7730104.1 DHA2 family efflux MFS transporter permease subunit [Rhodospirillaceae bacterium]MDC1441929.1 DHA2 family efflux MFS transporter permease subunit [Rhodospirillaceae bacterium]
MFTVNKPAHGPFTKIERIVITIPVLAASLLHSLNMSTAYVALPNIQGNLSAAPDQVGWVITAFVVATAIGTILTNLFSQKFGRRRVFLASIAGFTITSLFAATSGSLSELVFHRMLQGFVSAPLLPISQAIMLDTYPREKHGFAMSIWSMGMILGPVAGPTVGAMLTEFYDWRYVFFMNIPFGILAFVSILITLPAARSMRQKTDWLGIFSLIVAVVCLQLVLDRGERLGWFESSEILFNSMVSGVAFYIFIVHSLTTASPYISLKIFSDRNYVIGLALIFTFGIAVFASLFVLPLFLQNVQGYPVLSAGWVISSRGLGTMGAMLCSGFLLGLMPGKFLILFGLICVGGSNLWMTQWNADVGMEEVIWITMINGFGMGMMWVALTTVTFSTLPTIFRVEAASLFSLIRAIGASMGTSIVVSILVRSTQTNYIEMRSQISEFQAFTITNGFGGMLNVASELGLETIQNIVLSEAHMIAFLNDFVFLMVVAFLAMPLIFLLRSRS